ncbi:a9c6ec76-bdb3-49e5-9c28-31e25ad219dc [Sclerotinia trifoliorum]|uniref:A9c6ec76-bdb3-49e5-9c28-31e25ad219dc n=1 Tax=Sclerotinia trifoliorum TaxID=28548 RepID=A0A8H2VZW5_9HELO|nr:a9c6ec76-bdb3-49e5-9c28-31e25ad219dc [Sclerotinia trifoliorum]
MENEIFPAGILGNYYATRHEKGLYRSCGVTSYYSYTPQNSNAITSNAIDELISRIQCALWKTIEKHPSLCYGILPSSSTTHPTARFKRLAQISLEDIVSISSLGRFPNAEVQKKSEEKRVCEEIGDAHEQLFQDPETKPVWRIRVLLHGMEDGAYRVYILFIAHHAIADGLSCAAFQRTLHGELSAATVETLEMNVVQWPYIVPKTVGRPIAIENAMDISPPGYESLETNPQSNSDKKEEQIWSGNFPCMPTIESYKCLALLITVPPERVQAVLDTSHRLKITVTGYLHGLIVSYLARTTATNDQLGLKACTPYSLRKFSKLPVTEIANHVSTIVTKWNAGLLNSIRHVREGSVEEEELIGAIGSQVCQEISTELKRVEAGGVSQIRNVERIVDLESYCREGLSAERSETYEISNLGVVRMNKVPRESSLKLNGLIFSQCGMVFGAPIGCNVVNLEGGPLVISLTWQKGGVEDEVMEGLREFLKSRLGA